MIRLLLVDDESLTRDGIKAILSCEPDLQVVGIAEDGVAAIQQVEALQPDVVLMDIRMPRMDGKEATRAIAQRFPNVKVLVLGTFADADDCYFIDSIQAGAKGCLLKDMPSQDLAGVIRFVHLGYTQLAPGLLEKLLAQTSSSNGSQLAPVVAGGLTPRERGILRLIGTGATNREIAKQLCLSEGTVKGYITIIFNRLNLKNRAQLAVYANSVVWDAGKEKSQISA